MDSLKYDFSDKADRMEKRTLTALNEFKGKLDQLDSKVGKIIIVIVALAGGSGSLLTVVVKSLMGA